MSDITMNIIVIVYVLAVTIIGSYFGICTLKLRKRNKQLQEDMFRVIEQMTDLKDTCLELSNTEKKLIFSTLNWPEFKKEVEAQGLSDVYEHLKKKIQDSIED